MTGPFERVEISRDDDGAYRATGAVFVDFRGGPETSGVSDAERDEWLNERVDVIGAHLQDEYGAELDDGCPDWDYQELCFTTGRLGQDTGTAALDVFACANGPICGCGTNLLGRGQLVRAQRAADRGPPALPRPGHSTGPRVLPGRAGCHRPGRATSTPSPRHAGRRRGAELARAHGRSRSAGRVAWRTWASARWHRYAVSRAPAATDRLLTADELAEHLAVTPAYIRKRTRERTLPGRNLAPAGARRAVWRYDVAAVDRAVGGRTW